MPDGEHLSFIDLKIGNSRNMIDLEPDFWGYVRSLGNPHNVPAQVGFYKTMAESVGKPVVLWQIPVGNMAQNNTLNHYQDDKVDWFFSHMDQVSDAHIVALLFGAGHGEQTGPETDGGNLVNKTINCWQAGGTPLR